MRVNPSSSVSAAAESLKIRSFIDDKELLEVLIPMMGSKLQSLTRLDDHRFEVLMQEKKVHHFRADPKLKVPVDLEIVVPQRVILSYDAAARKVTFEGERVAVLPIFRWIGRWHVGDISAIASSEFFDEEGNRWFQITGEAHVTDIVKRALKALGVSQNTLWVTAGRIKALCR